MIEIRYGDQYEVTDLAGSTVREARDRYQEELGIPVKAYVKLNGSKLKAKEETKTVINDDDRLSFGVSRVRGAYYVAALLLALAITGSIFASGFISDTATLSATVYESNFADVTANTTHPITWTVTGNQKGAIAGPKGIFDIIPSPGYNGDLTATVTLANADELASQYRVLALRLEVVNQTDNTTIDISAGNSANWTMLTLDNGQASMYFSPTGDNLTIRILNGFFIAQAHPFTNWANTNSPELFCEVAQR